MQTVYNIRALKGILHHWHSQNQRIALVPTMGNLHQGHLTLVEKAQQLGDRTVVTIFVNPLQFSEGEDFAKYPRTLTEDQNKLAEKNVSLLFLPESQEIYPNTLDHAPRIAFPDLSDTLCGSFRPGHFTGVATVVLKLFQLVQPQWAIFGEKDYQQLLVIRRMVQEFFLPIEIVGIPTQREKSGLAMSSRNHYLSTQEKAVAAKLYRTLLSVHDQILKGNKHNYTLLEMEGSQQLRQLGFRPDYFSIRRSSDLAMPLQNDRQLTCLTAAWLGTTRLIDNISITIPHDDR